MGNSPSNLVRAPGLHLDTLAHLNKEANLRILGDTGGHPDSVFRLARKVALRPRDRDSTQAAPCSQERTLLTHRPNNKGNNLAQDKRNTVVKDIRQEATLPSNKVDLHRNRADPNLNKVDLHRNRADPNLNKVDVHLDRADLHRIREEVIRLDKAAVHRQDREEVIRLDKAAVHRRDRDNALSKLGQILGRILD
jgi:hypothetical protein